MDNNSGPVVEVFFKQEFLCQTYPNLPYSKKQ